MNVVGRVGSIISQGVYSVATPFHPFGGAVDIIVVEQEDGTYRSTPWYVRFGKFQGVLKGAEKVVTIAVNGEDANFHMYLDSSGEAYFLKEVVSGTNDQESTNQALNKSNHLENKQKTPTSSHDENFEDYMVDLNENRERVQEDVHEDEQTTIGNTSISDRFSNLEEVEDVVESSNDANSEMVLISVDGLVLTAPISASDENMESLPLDNPQFHLGPGEGPGDEFGSRSAMWEDGLYVNMESRASKENYALENPLKFSNDSKVVSFRGEQVQSVVKLELSNSSEDIAAIIGKEDVFRSCLDLTSHVQDLETKDDSKNPHFFSSSNTIMPIESSIRENGAPLLSSLNVEMKDLENNANSDTKQNDDQIGSEVAHCDSNLLSDETLTAMKNAAEASEKSLAVDNMTQEGSIEVSVNNLKNVIECASERHEISPTKAEINQTEDQEIQSSISRFGFEISLCGNLLRPGMGRAAAEQAFDAHLVSEDEFKTSGQSIINNKNLIVRYKEMYLAWDKAANLVVGKAVYGSGFSCDIKDQIPIDLKEITSMREEMQGASLSSSSSRRWRLWPIPFRRSRTLEHTNSDPLNEDLFVNTETGGQNPQAEQNPVSDSNPSPRKQLLHTYIPTTEQIGSLNLKDGQNMVAFSFSTRVLGKQQVDAHIYLWKWNARIVISDVDGTITKSDVLGQVMPLVGKDWTQSGVARLFSAIKENGYQLLFLSARAIVQAYLTRSFLLNLKQDGKALPSGPVVISPDGLFPSLFREVIRRAPHEFKIACLEDIRALFPSDYNPFYAGFGNRDTDELSYRKIGIAKGKIFIINPKGEVAINNCIDVKSYTSLHTLVNDMFPPTSLVEQEDFNSWNYWKMPLPRIDA
ncbi:LOW QUALITY PROTEIN: phosphatidate phosphatase PAH1-like [Phalaenopsis equestris]|uniref:LOW QUALITY PROTEIN: phosphatidate phosphatase PAH1-like n=1 Tax=Phalaenopsis equestris TaxID=78828 RepID=UPI0009E2CCF5|nr:LOW QUALITY PROTEIN: phosphatidate phosphatase PAH1-like [Phalaenopsis equestris]